jgi:hypothetical protein
MHVNICIKPTCWARRMEWSSEWTALSARPALGHSWVFTRIYRAHEPLKLTETSPLSLAFGEGTHFEPPTGQFLFWQKFLIILLNAYIWSCLGGQSPAVRVRVQVISCRICGEQSGTGMEDFSLSTSVSLVCHSTDCSTLLIIIHHPGPVQQAK